MFNFEKREILIISFLLILLLVGLSISIYQHRARFIDVKTDVFVPGDDTQYEPKKININEADLKAFTSIRGIGKSLAARILEYRSQSGRFRSTEELKKVKGIGDKLFDRIKDRVSVD